MRNTGGGGWMAPEKKNYNTGNIMFAGKKNIISREGDDRNSRYIPLKNNG